MNPRDPCAFPWDGKQKLLSTYSKHLTKLRDLKALGGLLDHRGTRKGHLRTKVPIKAQSWAPSRHHHHFRAGYSCICLLVFGIAGDS